jgi:outer membrane receptor protein involved in Fe transport
MLTCLGLIPVSIAAQTTTSAEDIEVPGVTETENVVTYPAAFFSRYRPDSALDMLKQLPGFIMAVSGELRGYGSDAGNVLIDGRRPSSKRMRVPSILDRIPSSQVERIELIRGPIRDIELLGEPEVANVVLRTDMPAAVRWSAEGRRNSDVDLMPWFSNLSLSDRWGDIDYNAGLDIFKVVYSEINDERIEDGSGNLIETRAEQGFEKEFEANFDLTASTWVGETLLTWNSQIGIQDGGEEYLSSRTPLLPGETNNSEVIDGISDELQIEAGITAERRLTPDLRGNLLAYVSREKENEETFQRRLDASGAQTDEIFRDTDQIEEEAILRTEFEWSAFADHTVRLNLEGIYNRVANMMVQNEDDGTGPVTVFVPGANTTIKEYRGDFLLKDTWSFGQFELDYGMGFEVSKLSQAGDADTSRSLTYLKPSAELSYTPSDIQKVRVRVAREVAQLVFQEFISASLFQDEDVVIANPELRPETIWVSELGYERRFGAENVLKLTLFHHWISDVQDLIPIALTQEAPGNIGDGRRTGLKLESTLQMDWLGLQNGRLDVNAVFQDSSVTDPVTGEKRILTAGIIPDSNSSRSIFENDNQLVAVIDFRQDFEELDMAWGWDVTLEGDLPVHKIDEFDIRNKEPDLSLFIETTRWLGMKMRLEFNNALDRNKERERTFYTAQRGLSPILRRQIQQRSDGREFGLSLSGSF